MPRRSRFFPALAATVAFAAPAIAADPAESGGARAPKTELENLAVADGLAVDLFAAEPMLLSPSNIDVDAQGRVWVCEIVNYRHFRNAQNEPREKGDRILVLHDADHDGQLDQRTVFYQSPEIDSPHGVCVLGDTVIVSAGENVLKFRDEDGDLKADPGSREVLFTGIGGVQHDHGIHSFLFGPDGKLYFNFGNEGGQLLRPDGSPVIDLAGNEVKAGVRPYQQGMIFRCDLDGSNVETLAWNFRNNWELAVDSFGRIWQSDNDDDGNRGTRLNFVVPYGNYGYRDEFTGAGWRERRVNMEDEIPLQHWHLNDPGVMPNLIQTGAGSPTGIAVYEGDLLPEKYRGNLLHCDAGPNAVRAYFLEPDGAGFKAEQRDILTGENDRWFRPSDVCVAPDGSLIVADWYDPGVGGHLMEDLSRGRLFRIRPEDSEKAYVAPELDLSTPAGALAALNSPNLDARYQGYTALIIMGTDAEAAVRSQLADETLPDFQRARAMWVLAELGEAEEAFDYAFNAGSPFAPAAVRLARMYLPNENRLLPRLMQEMRELGASSAAFYYGAPSPAIQREAAVSLRLVSDAERVAPMWSELAGRYGSGDRWMLETLGLAADGRWDAILPAYLDARGEEWRSDSAARDIVWRSRSSHTPALLAELIRDPATPADEIPRYLRAFDFQEDSETKRAAVRDLAFADDLPADRAGLVNLEMLSRLGDGGSDEDAAAAKAAVARVLDAAAGTERFVDLSRQFGAVDREEALFALALSKPDTSEGVAAAKLLIDWGKWEEFGDRAWGGDREVAAAAIAVLGRTGEGSAADFLRDVMDDEDLDVSRRRQAVAALGGMWGGVDLLLNRAEAGELAPELEQSAAVALHATGLQGFRSRIDAAFPPPPGRDEPLPSVGELARTKGDVRAGKLVFMTTGTCSKCHVVNGVGKNVGPDLSEIGDKLGRQALFSSILYPSAGISHNYETHTVLTDDGRFASGLLVSETDDEIRIKDQEGIERTFQKDSLLESGVQDVSLMPADIQKLMSEQDLVDLVEFLTTLNKAK